MSIIDLHGTGVTNSLSAYQRAKTLDLPKIMRAPAAPIDFGFGGVAGSAPVAATPPGGGAYGFPERVSIALAPIFEGVSSLARAPQVAISNLKMIPGNPIGTTLGNVGQQIEHAPGIGGALGFAKDIVTSPFESLGYLFDPQRQAEKQAQGVSDIFGSADPWQQLITNITAPSTRGQLGAGINLLASTATFGAGGLALKGAEKGAGAAVKGFGKGLFDPAFGDLTNVNPLRWLTGQGMTQAEGVVKASSAEFSGRLFGRATIALSGLGVIEQNALQRLAPDSEWTQKVVNERLVPDDSFWSMPIDLALSGSQDIFGLIGAANKFRIASPEVGKVASWVFGTHPATHLTETFGPGWEKAVNDGVVKLSSIQWFHNKSIDGAVEARLIDIANLGKLETEPLAKVVTDLNQATQSGFNAAKRATLQRLIETEGLPGVFNRAKEVINGVKGDEVRTGWTDFMSLSQQDRLIHLDEYATWGPRTADSIPGRLATPATNAARQSKDAIGYLGSLGEWTPDAKAAFSWNYPALQTYIKDTKEATRKALGRVSGGAKATKLTPEETAARRAPRAVQTGPNAPSIMEQFGALRAERRSIAQQVLKDGSPNPRLTEIDNQIAKIRDGVAGKLKRTLEGADAQLKTRLAEIHSGKLTGDALRLAEAEVTRLEGEVSSLTAQFYDASLIGTRYHLDYAPRTRFLSTVTPVTSTPIGTGRTTAGKVFDTLFGGIPNKSLAIEAHKYLRDAAAGAKGYTDSKYQAALAELEKIVKRGQKVYPGGFMRSRYQGIWHIEPGTFRSVMEDHIGAAPEGRNWSEIQFRSYPSPMKVFQKQVLGKEALVMPYNETLHYLTRSLYPMFRFYLSPRFLLLNLAENSIYRYTLGAAQQGEQVPERLQRYVNEIANGRRIDTSFVGTGDQLNLAGLGKLTMAFRPAEMSSAVLQALHDTPVMQDILKQEGITTHSQLASFLQKTIKDREALWGATDTVGPAEQAMAKKIGEINNRVATTPKEQVELWQAKRDAQAQLDDLVIRRRQQAFTGAWRPELDPLVQAQWAHEMAQADHARQVLFGNPQRNAVERLLNSYMLYWPISYQLKAGRTMFEFMFSRGFGFKTNTTIAQQYDHLRQWHDAKLQSDPEYAGYFQKNKQLIFLLQQLFPATPDEIGVTLSPALRLPLQVARGYRSPSQAFDRAIRTGVVGDFSLFSDIVKEQSKPGGFVHDFFQGFKQDNGG